MSAKEPAAPQAPAPGLPSRGPLCDRPTRGLRPGGDRPERAPRTEGGDAPAAAPVEAGVAAGSPASTEGEQS